MLSQDPHLRPTASSVSERLVQITQVTAVDAKDRPEDAAALTTRSAYFTNQLSARTPAIAYANSFELYSDAWPSRHGWTTSSEQTSRAEWISSNDWMLESVGYGEWAKSESMTTARAPESTLVAANAEHTEPRTNACPSEYAEWPPVYGRTSERELMSVGNWISGSLDSDDVPTLYDYSALGGAINMVPSTQLSNMYTPYMTTSHKASAYAVLPAPWSFVDSKHADDTTAVCERCGASFAGTYRRGNLARHQRQRHAMERTKSYGCTVCFKEFQRGDAMRTHMWRKHNCFDSQPRPREHGTHESDSSRHTDFNALLTRSERSNGSVSCTHSPYLRAGPLVRHQHEARDKDAPSLTCPFHSVGTLPRRRPDRSPGSYHSNQVIGQVTVAGKFRCLGHSCTDLTFGRQADFRRHYENNHAPRSMGFLGSQISDESFDRSDPLDNIMHRHGKHFAALYGALRQLHRFVMIRQRMRHHHHSHAVSHGRIAKGSHTAIVPTRYMHSTHGRRPDETIRTRTGD
jgi:hypothetical protein